MFGFWRMTLAFVVGFAWCSYLVNVYGQEMIDFTCKIGGQLVCP